MIEIVTDEELGKERAQLVDTWKKLLAGEGWNWKKLLAGQGWREELERQIGVYFSLMSSSEDKRHSAKIRQIHDVLGFMAKDGKNGLCAGAIFRTSKFIKETNRVGSGRNGPLTIHIEHTVPIAELDRQLRGRVFFVSDAARVKFLLVHSVTTAFDIHEKTSGISTDYSSKSDAFDKDKLDFKKPFARYKPLFEKGGVVWNVFDKVCVDQEEFTFDHHREIIHRLITECSRPD